MGAWCNKAHFHEVLVSWPGAQRTRVEGLPEDDLEEDPDPCGHLSSLHSACGSWELIMTSCLSCLRGLCTGSSLWWEGSYPPFDLTHSCSSAGVPFLNGAFSDRSCNLLHPSCYCPSLIFLSFSPSLFLSDIWYTVQFTDLLY